MPAKKKDATLLALLSVVMCLLIVGTFVGIYSDMQTKQWPSVTGFIVENGTTYSRMLPGTWSARFTYEVSGNQYQQTDTGGRFGKPIFLTNNQAVHYVNEHYPIGTEVTVFYDPNNPSSAVLNKGVQRIHLIFIPLLLFLGLVTWFVRFR